MIIVLKHGIKAEDKSAVRSYLESAGLSVREIVGEEDTIFGAVGQVKIDPREVETLVGVDRVIPISKPYKLASRELKKDDTVFQVGPIKIGGERIVVVAGPCAVESRRQIIDTAWAARESGAVMLRGGAYKPRTSPYAFQGLGEEGLKYLKEAGEATGMPVMTEIVSTEHVRLMADYVDVFQIGARNMQNFELLKAVGALGKPVLLKRGLSATILELLMSAEYLLASGTDKIILCERGIRTFETYTRNTLDISAIPVLRQLCHLPVFVDPSHATGIRDKVPPMALASVAAGAHGILVEMHLDPDHALSDGPQSLFPEQFEKLMRDIEVLAPVVGKEIARLPDRRHAAESAVAAAVAGPRPAGSAVRVAFQGESGAFSETAARMYFETDALEIKRCEPFVDIFEAVLSGEADFGVVPLENSLAGSIHENYDNLLRYPDLRIVGEKRLRIEHNLIGLPDASIDGVRRVYSHPQGLAQCARFLDGFPKWERVPYYDTAASVGFIAREGKKEYAAIASARAAEANKMKILKPGIETNPRNYTRFVILAREDPSTALGAGADKPDLASIVFACQDKPGSLFRTMGILARYELNMRKLESRPIEGKPWEYMFYVDVEIKDKEAAFAKAVGELSAETDDFRILGKYRV